MRPSKSRGLISWWCLSVALLAPPAKLSAFQSNPLSSHSAISPLQQAANASRERGDTEESTRLYRRALQQNERWQDGWWYYGSLLYDANKYQEAERAFQKLVDLNGTLGDAWAMLGLSAYDCRDFPTAFHALERSDKLGTQLDPEIQNVADYHLALLLNMRGDSDAASMILSSLFLRGIRSEDLQVALGLSLLRVPILPDQLDPSRDALVHDAGNIAALCAQQRYDKAELAFKDLETRYPNVDFIHYAFGSMLSSMGRDQDAEDQLRAETQLNPQDALAYLEWSFIESKDKNFPESKRLAAKAVQLSSTSFMAHYLLGNANLNMGDVKAAVPDLETAKKLAPEVPDVRYGLARAYARLGEVDKAQKEQTEFLALQRKNAIDRSILRKKYPSAQPVTGMRPITPE
ncbi:MAG: tetratricopeptide repeat protein [Acidobacteriaceae bacterium]